MCNVTSAMQVCTTVAFYAAAAAAVCMSCLPHVLVLLFISFFFCCCCCQCFAIAKFLLAISAIVEYFAIIYKSNVVEGSENLAIMLACIECECGVRALTRDCDEIRIIGNGGTFNNCDGSYWQIALINSINNYKTDTDRNIMHGAVQGILFFFAILCRCAIRSPFLLA